MSHQMIIPINHVNARFHILVRSLFVVYQYHHIAINIVVVAQNIDMIEFNWNTKNITDRNTPFIALYVTNIIWAVSRDSCLIFAVRYRTNHSSIKANQ